MTKTLIRVASDLHLEQFYGMDIEPLTVEVLPSDPRDLGAILVLAGDISSKPDQLCNFLKHIESRFKHVVYVPGNHEWYRHDMTTWIKDTKELLHQNLTNTTFSLDEMRGIQIGLCSFIIGTFWTDGGQDQFEMCAVENALNDFRIVTLNGKRFTVADMQKIHREMKADLQSFLPIMKASGTPVVVVTHHMPSYRLCATRFGNTINGGFASNCDAILASEDAPDVWIHGHTHDTNDTQLFNTRIVCNPRGYHREFSDKSEFNQYKVEPKFIEV